MMRATASVLLFAVLVTGEIPQQPVPNDSCTRQADEDAIIESMRTVMLQERLHLSPVAAEEKHLLYPGVETLAPVTWLHVPKCGTSFVNVLLHLRYVCELPINLTVETHLDGFIQGVLSRCPGGFMEEEGIQLGDHSGIGNVYDEYVKGHGMVMLRQPEQRIISAWNDNYHSWQFDVFGRAPADLQEFAAVVAGCAVKMITRSGISSRLGHRGSVCGSPNVTSEETELAVQRLREGFVFVGLTEEWDLSMCPFHKMFGGSCHASDFTEVSHIGPSLEEPEPIPKSTEDPSLYKTTELGGFKDAYDGRLYEEARRIFKCNLEHYNVSRANCQQCFIDAGL